MRLIKNALYTLNEECGTSRAWFPGQIHSAVTQRRGKTPNDLLYSMQPRFGETHSYHFVYFV